MKDITQKAMLAKLRLGMWGAETIDRSVTAEVISQQHAQSNAGKFIKTIFASPHYDEYKKLAGATRTFVRANSMPWDDNATRLLPVSMFDDFTEGVNVHFLALKEAKNNVIEDFEDCQDREKARLGDMFNPTDFPSVRSVADKFQHSMDFWPIPSAGDWRVDLDKERMSEMEASTKQMVTDRLEAAMGDLWQRTYEQLERLHKNLSKDSRYYDSFVENLRDLVDILPDMNLMEDPRLTKLAEDLRLGLCTHDMDDYRKDVVLRGDAIKSCDKAMDTIKGFGAFVPAT